MSSRVSVVTPFYNSAQYLEECIASVLAQSFTDFEYVLVNNCSSDDSLQIARKHASQDRRIRVVSNEQFLSQVQNYNAALAQISAHSVYCKMVQADDWLYPRCLEEMVALADTDASVGIVSSYRLAGRQVKEVGLPHTAGVSPGRQICRMQLMEGVHFFGSPSTVMFRSQVVRARQPFYAEGRYHEDTEACYEILGDWNFGFVHQVLSFTRTDNESIMSGARRFNPALLDKLILVGKYGPQYLSAREYEQCWRDHEQRYLRYLAQAKLRGAEPAFWEYHRKGLATAGYELSSVRLAGYVLLELIDLALNPKNTISQVFRRLKK